MNFKPGDKVLIRKSLVQNDFVVGVISGMSIWSRADGSKTPLWEVRYNNVNGRFAEESLKPLTDPNVLIKDIL